jgi:hypothetical protein
LADEYDLRGAPLRLRVALYRSKGVATDAYFAARMDQDEVFEG